jgi:hypothetical protein
MSVPFGTGTTTVSPLALVTVSVVSSALRLGTAVALKIKAYVKSFLKNKKLQEYALEGTFVEPHKIHYIWYLSRVSQVQKWNGGEGKCYIRQRSC